MSLGFVRGSYLTDMLCNTQQQQVNIYSQIYRAYKWNDNRGKEGTGSIIYLSSVQCDIKYVKQTPFLKMLMSALFQVQNKVCIHLIDNNNLIQQSSKPEPS